MKKRSFLVLLLCLCLSPLLFAENGDLGVSKGANGTESAPWLIEDFSDFQVFCSPPAPHSTDYWATGVYTRLETDLDLDPVLPGRGIYGGCPIGFALEFSNPISGFPYSGIFDGNGHVISNLVIVGRQYCGLFGYLEQGASVSNLGVLNVDITASGLLAGGLCGHNNYATISNCYTTGSIVSNNENTTGGLCGSNFHGEINNCYSTCTVSGRYHAGGLCGSNGGTINNSYASGQVSGAGSIGGFCGSNGSNNGIIKNCYSSGPVNGEENAGGFSGTNNGIISNCYTVGMVSGDSSIGGFSGDVFNSSNISNCFWNTETSDIADPESGSTDTDGMIGLTIAQMQAQTTFTDAGWDFNAETDNGTDDLWHMPFNTTGYPMLDWQRDIPGDLTGSYGIDLTDFSELSTNWINMYDLTDLEDLAANWLK